MKSERTAIVLKHYTSLRKMAEAHGLRHDSVCRAVESGRTTLPKLQKAMADIGIELKLIQTGHAWRVTNWICPPKETRSA